MSGSNEATYRENAEALQMLFERAAQQGQEVTAFDDFLNFVVRFRRFSAFNAMMIYAQKPGASAVGSKREWERIGRDVIPGAQAIVILRMFGPISFVYELNDTSGRPVPGEGTDPFQASGTVRRSTWDRIVNGAKKLGVDVEVVSHFGANLAGIAAMVTDMPADEGQGMWIEEVKAAPEMRIPTGKPTGFPYWRIGLNASHDEATRFSTLVHELGHIYCGHLGHGPAGAWPSRRQMLNLAQREIEAEAVCWLVCKRAGVRTRSAEYLSRHVSSEAVRGISVFSILSAVNRVEGA